MAKMMRINEHIDDHIKELMELTGKRRLDILDEILEKALFKFKKEYFLIMANKEAQAIVKDKKAHAEFKREYEAWDTTLQDGLEEYKDDAFAKKRKNS